MSDADAAWVGPIEPGGRVGGFVVEAVAGRGGMGVVYRARQEKPDRLVALKVIATELAGDPAFRARFEREATIAAQIEHPNVIPVHAVGEDRGILYIAMRFVPGIDLRTLIVQQERLEPRRAAAIVDQVAQALDAAHACGLVHRDVKPANILLATNAGRDHVYLTDFGLSRHVEGSSDGVTGTGAFLGTIDYVAPEQARADRVDARTDVYSLGCVLFHALTGSVPFPLTNDLAKLYAHGTQEPPSVCDRAPEVPAAFDPVVMRAMAKAPDDRYLSAGDLGRAAVLAATNTAGSRAETSVAVGAAAPLAANPVPPRPTPAPPQPDEATQTAARTDLAAGPTAPLPAAPAGSAAPRSESSAAETAATPSTPRRLRMVIAGAAIVVVAVVAVLIATAGGGGPKPLPKVAGPVAVGLVPGRSLGPVTLGELPAAVTARLTAAGWAPKPTGPYETDFTKGDQTLVVDSFDNGRVSQIHKYGDPSVTVGGVSVDSTLAQARAALPDWYLIRCPSKAILAAPAGRTFFELELGPNVGNVDGGNGVDVISSPVDRSICM